MNYRPDAIREAADLVIQTQSGPEPSFDSITKDFLFESRREFMNRCVPGSLVEFASLGHAVPWLYRLTFKTHGLGRDGEAGEVRDIDRHTIALRFLPDYLRRAKQFEMLRYVAPQSPAPFHPNICPNTGAICWKSIPASRYCELSRRCMICLDGGCAN